jgi:signal transduction histidine kinase
MKALINRFLAHPRLVMAVTIVLVVTVWGYYLYNVGTRLGHPFEGFIHNPAGVVSALTPQSWTGLQAGLRMKDAVVAVNGQPWTQLRRVVREAGVGNPIVYTVLRGGQTLDIAVPTMEFTLNMLLWFVPPVLTFNLVCMAVGLFVYSYNPSGFVNRLVLLYHTLWALSGPVHWDQWMGRQTLSSYLFPALIGIPTAVGWHFFWTFAADRPRRDFLARWPLIQGFYAWAGIFTLFPAFEKLLGRLNRPELWALYAQVVMAFVYIAGPGSLIIKPLPAILIARKKATSRPVRQQCLALAAAFLIGYSANILLTWAPSLNWYAPPIDMVWGYIIMIMYPLTIGYAVLRYQLFDVRVVIRRGLVYSILTAGLTAIFLVLSMALGYVFQSWAGQQTFLAAVVPALVVAVMFRPAQTRVQTFVDRAFFRHEYEVRQTLTGFSHGLSTLRDQDEVTRLVLDTVTQTLGAEQATFWVLDAEHKAYRPVRQTSEVSQTSEVLRELPAASEVPFWLFAERRPLMLAPSETSAQADQLRQLGAVLAVPLIAEQRLLGFLTLGTKRSGLLYTDDDLDLLASLAQSATLALENARLHEERLAILRQQLAQVTAAQEEERQRIARELHDGVGPALASLNLRLRTAGKLVQPNPAAAQELKELAELTQANIQDIRRLIYDLRPAVLDELGLVAALKEYVQRYQQEQGLQVQLSLPEGKDRLPAPLETTLFRVIQEALTNAARHAKAKHVEVTLDWDAAQVSLRIADDGQGFDLQEATARAKGGQHLGLWSMRERIEQLGGRLRIDSQLGSGTTIQATVPLTEVTN